MGLYTCSEAACEAVKRRSVTFHNILKFLKTGHTSILVPNLNLVPIAHVYGGLCVP